MKLLPEETSGSWNDFVGKQLKDMNEKNKIIPASSYVNEISSNEDDDSDFRDLHFPQESALQQVWASPCVCFLHQWALNFQMYSDYQMQQMSEHFVDSFGFSGDQESGKQDMDV